MIHALTYAKILKAPQQTVPKSKFHPGHPGMGMEKRVAIIEDYIANGLMINEICVIHNVSYVAVCETITRYFKKPKEDMVLQSQV